MILDFTVGIVAFDCLMVAFAATVSEIARHIRRRGAPRHPEPDWAFLANCVWCADLSDDPHDCTCETACEQVSWCVTGMEERERLATTGELAALLDTEGGHQ